MILRKGKQTLLFQNPPSLIGFGSAVGKTEGEGPLCAEFDCIFTDDTLEESSFEKAESKLQQTAIGHALQKAALQEQDIHYILGGDLLNQCTATAFALRDFSVPVLGLYGACSTMALSLGLAGVLTASGAAEAVIAETSSHFCSAERQFRLPLEYGGQRTPTAQHTATAAGATVVSAKNESGAPKLRAVTFGKIQDLNVTDANNMGAAMAPAAASTIAAFLQDTGTTPTDYSLILTGDLGKVGSELLRALLKKDYHIDIREQHKDCGLLLYDTEKQDMHAGGSGCGCAAAVFNSYVMHRLKDGRLSRVLLVATGALMSPTSSMQGESIPSIAHAVLLEKPNLP